MDVYTPEEFTIPYKIVNENYSPTAGQYYAEVVINDPSDIEFVPTDFAPGSIVISVTSPVVVFMMNLDHAWICISDELVPEPELVADPGHDDSDDEKILSPDPGSQEQEAN